MNISTRFMIIYYSKWHIVVAETKWNDSCYDTTIRIIGKNNVYKSRCSERNTGVFINYMSYTGYLFNKINSCIRIINIIIGTVNVKITQYNQVIIVICKVTSTILS